VGAIPEQQQLRQHVDGRRKPGQQHPYLRFTKFNIRFFDQVLFLLPAGSVLRNTAFDSADTFHRLDQMRIGRRGLLHRLQIDSFDRRRKRQSQNRIQRNRRQCDNCQRRAVIQHQADRQYHGHQIKHGGDKFARQYILNFFVVLKSLHHIANPPGMEKTER